MGQAQINVRTRACSRTSIARTKQAALTHNVRGKELRNNRNKTIYLYSDFNIDLTAWKLLLLHKKAIRVQ